MAPARHDRLEKPLRAAQFEHGGATASFCVEYRDRDGTGQKRTYPNPAIDRMHTERGIRVVMPRVQQCVDFIVRQHAWALDLDLVAEMLLSSRGQY